MMTPARKSGIYDREEEKEHTEDICGEVEVVMDASGGYPDSDENWDEGELEHQYGAIGTPGEGLREVINILQRQECEVSESRHRGRCVAGGEGFGRIF